jgi:diacylglycerol O-acyltransferase / wax synthase
VSRQHLEGLDSVFVTMDAPNTPLHVGVLLELEPDESTTLDPSLRFEEIQTTIIKRLGSLPELHRRFVRVPFDLGSPIIIDDPDFDISFHVVRRAIASPGGPEELEALVARIMARPLAPDRPMWEISVIEGLENGRTGILAKIHHALADGISGVTVFASLFDLSPDQPRDIIEISTPPTSSVPSAIEMFSSATGEMLRRPIEVVGVVGSALERMAGRVEHVVNQLASSTPTLLAAPKTSLSGTVSHSRNFERLCLSLPQVKDVARSHGGTVTDVATTITGGAIRRLLELRGEAPDKELVAFMPVSIRVPGTEGQLGNRVSGRLVPMATELMDPFVRLEALTERSRAAKAKGMPQSDFFGDLADALGPAAASMAGRVVSAFELFEYLPNVANVILSSVPGPSFPLWCSGERIVRASPMGPLMFNQALNITLLSYCDILEFGILGCAKKVPDAALLRELMEDEATRLLGVEGTTSCATSA